MPSLLDLSLDRVTYEDVRAFVDEGIRESAALEYKEPKYNSQSQKFEFDEVVLSTVVAFANSGLGLLIVGVTDRDKTGFPGEIVGIRLVARPDDKPRDPVQVMRDKCASEIESKLSLEIQQVTIPDGEPNAGNVVLLVRVRPGLMPPYFLRSRGIYVRQDDADRLATVREIEDMIDRRRREETRPIQPWAEALNTAFANIRTGTPERRLFLMKWLRPSFLLNSFEPTQGVIGSFRQFATNSTDTAISRSLFQKGVYAPYLMESFNSQDVRAHDYACAFDDGTIASRDFYAERSAASIQEIDLPHIWHKFRQALLTMSGWPKGVCGYRGTMRCRIGTADLSDTIVRRRPTTMHLPAPNIRNRLPGWEYEGIWHDEHDVDEFIAAAMRNLARQLQCRWYLNDEENMRREALRYEGN